MGIPTKTNGKGEKRGEELSLFRPGWVARRWMRRAPGPPQPQFARSPALVTHSKRPGLACILS